MRLSIRRLRSWLVILGMTSTLIGLGSISAVHAKQWYFKVANKSSSRIVRLEVKEAGGSWGAFDIGDGIKPGQTVRIDWDQSTNNQDCDQLLRAQFSDGSWSGTTKINFCEDLDNPIEYTD